MKTERVIKTEHGDVTIKKLTIREYAEVFQAVTDLPKLLSEHLAEGQAVTNETIISLLPVLIGKALPDFARILAIASDKDQEFLLSLDGGDFTDVAVGAFELNDFSRVVGNVKKLLARKPNR